MTWDPTPERSHGEPGSVPADRGAHDTMALLRVVLAIVAAPALIAAWALTYGAGCMALAGPALAAWALYAYGSRLRRARRDALADAYFESGRLVHRLARSRVRVFVSALVDALVLTVVLFSAVPFWSDRVWLALAADAVLIGWLYRALVPLLTRRIGVRPRLGAVVAGSWTLALNTPLLVGALLVLTLYDRPPAYMDPHGDFAAATADALAFAQSRCRYTAWVLGLGAHGEAARWTAAGLVSAAIEVAPLRWTLWGLFLAGGALAAVAYGRLGVQFARLFLAPRPGEKDASR